MPVVNKRRISNKVDSISLKKEASKFEIYEWAKKSIYTCIAHVHPVCGQSLTASLVGVGRSGHDVKSMPDSRYCLYHLGFLMSEATQSGK